MADAGDLYDEFGNYIGPELSESEEVRGGRGQPAASLPAHLTAVPVCASLLPALLLHASPTSRVCGC